jgi:hypothetical protein
VAILVAALSDAAQLLSDKRSDQQLSPADWVTLANWSVKSLWRLLTSLDPDSYFTQYDFTLAGGTAGASFDLTTLAALNGTLGTWAQFRALHGLDYNPDTSGRYTIRRRNFTERNAGRVGTRWIPSILDPMRAYDLRGYTLVITPYELAGGPYRVYYRYAPYLFTGASDTHPLDAQLEPYEQYLSAVMARTALGIEESAQDPLAALCEELKQEMVDEHERDDEAATVIGDVEGGDGTSYDRQW